MSKFFRKNYEWVFVLSSVFGPAVLSSQAQTVPPTAILLHDDAVQGAEAARWEQQLFLSPAGLTAENHAEPGKVSIPRFASSLTGIEWLGQASDGSLSVAIEQDHWIVQWTHRPAMAKVVVLSFDLPPQLMSEVEPQKAAGDGSIFLRACQATTTGEKIRYEPQTFKNTVGYWVGKQDSCEWRFEAPRPGLYNVAVLQGCGMGQGGSRAKLSVLPNDQPAAIEFEVLETGNFQNFQWRHLGTMHIDSSGVHTLKIEPIEIKQAALGDIRAVHLIPVPE